MPVLPDVLAPGLRVVFCGTAAGEKSTQVGAYYAGPGNRFWEMLCRIGLTPRQFEPHEFHALVGYGIGFTDMVKERSGSDKYLAKSDFDGAGLRARIERYAPHTLAFNGKRATQEFYGRRVAYGRQPEMIGQTTVFVLPSTSGAARGFWDESHWWALAAYVNSAPAKSVESALLEQERT